jgi:predicted nucleotidyltransferase
MKVHHQIDIPIDALADICERYDVQELSLFGSVLRDDFRLDSDVDVLVVYRPGTRRGLFKFYALQEELERLLGRTVDLVPKEHLKPMIRDDVLSSSEIIYAA